MPVTTPEFKENIKIAKSVTEMEKILKAVAGNPATIKAKKDEEKKLVKEQKKVLSQWFEVLDEQQEQLEKRKVTTGAMFSFIGIQTKKYFAETERQAVTWGGLAKSIGQGVKNWFNTAKEQNTALGFTLRLGASLWKGVNDHIIGTIRNVFGKIGSELREVLGELSGVFDFIKGMFMGVFNFIKDTFLGFFKKAPPHATKRNKLLKKIVDFMRRAEKRDLLEFAVPDRSIQALLLPLAMIAAALVGGMVRRFLMPFEAIWKVFRIGPIFKKIKDFFLSVKNFANKIFKITFIKWGRKIAGIFGKIGPLAKFAGVLGKLGRAFAFGFRILGRPLAIILGVIDFIWDFVKAEGNLADRIRAGVEGAVMGFIKLPVQFFGWVIEKTLGIFGVEVDGIADKILGFISGFFDLWVGFFRPIIGLIEGLFTGGFQGAIKGFFEGMGKFFEILKPLTEKIEPLRQAIIDFFTAIGNWFGSIIDKFKPLLSWFGIEFGAGAEAPIPGGLTGGEEAGGAFTTMSQAEANAKQAQQDTQTQAVVSAIEDQTQKQIASDEKLSKEQGDNIAVAMANPVQTAPAKDTEKQLPSEELFSFAMGNSNMGF